MKTIIVRFEMERKYVKIFDSIIHNMEGIELYHHDGIMCVRTIDVKESLVMEVVSRLIRNNVNFEMSINYF